MLVRHMPGGQACEQERGLGLLVVVSPRCRKEHERSARGQTRHNRSPGPSWWQELVRASLRSTCPRDTRATNCMSEANATRLQCMRYQTKQRTKSDQLMGVAEVFTAMTPA